MDSAPRILILVLILFGLYPAFANNQLRADQASCDQIRTACKNAGFVLGGGARDGLLLDCYQPIVQGTPQPKLASRPLPRINPEVVNACRSGNGSVGAKTASVDEATRPEPLLASTDDSAPGGLVVVIVDKPKQDRLDLRALDNSSISGVALQIHWGDIEPVEGKPDWTKLDQLFAAAESSKKWVQLLIFPGFFSPPWALEGVKTEQFPIQYGPGAGTVMSLPMPWDNVYLNRWFEFLRLLNEKYGKSPAFRLIGAAGPTSVSAEMTLPSKPEDMRTWQSDGYTSRKYIEAWQKVFQVYSNELPNQNISFSLGAGLNINNQGNIEPGEGMRTRQTVIDQAVGLLGRRFALQDSDLSAGPVQRPAGINLVTSYSGRIITGLQLRTSAERESADMGAAGNPPLALRKCIELGMRPNQAGRHINYLEMYEPDILADDMQPVLTYATSLFKAN